MRRFESCRGHPAGIVLWSRAVETRTASPLPKSIIAGRIPQQPGLDGLRAVAVVAVLLWHAEVGVVRGGFLGVESFFVVSGYLITALLWSERSTTGRTSLAGFWLRRARRLLPALYLLLLVVLVALVVGWWDLVARARGDAIAAAVYVSNWYQLASERSYFAETGQASPFKHLWSLAVEEQFYLIWPLLFLALLALWRGDRVKVAATVAGLAAASGLAMALAFALREDPSPGVPYDPSRLYYGLDTRAGGLLLGCALALLWRPWERSPDAVPMVEVGRRLPSWAADLAGLGGGALLVLCFWRLGEGSPLVYLGGLQLVALTTSLVIVGATRPGSLTGRVLGARPLVAIGRRSYSLYLWHWPVYVVTRPELDLPWSSGPTLVLRLALSAGLAELSYRYVEVPVRSGALGRSLSRVQRNLRGASPDRRRQVRRSWTALGSLGLGLLLLVGTVVAMAEPPPPLDSLLATEGALAEPEGEPSPAVDALVPTGAGAEDGTTPSTKPPPPGADPNAVIPGSSAGPGSRQGVAPARVYAIGDSVMLGARTALADAIPGIVVNAKLGRFMGEGSGVVSALAQRGLLPGAFVVHLGTNGPATASDVTNIVEAAQGRPVVLVTVRVPRRWEGVTNSAIAEGVADQPNVKVVDWKRLSDRCKGGDVLYDDGTHLRPAGAACYASLIRAALL